MLVIRNPTINTTPDPGQGGLAVTGNTNTGHGSTTSSAANGSTQTKTCNWSSFQSTAGLVIGLKLKVSWSVDGSLTNGGTSLFLISYSINGGSSWINLVVKDNPINLDSGTSEVVLSIGQNISQIQVRDSIQADAALAGDAASITASVSDIKIEVTLSDSTFLD